MFDDDNSGMLDTVTSGMFDDDNSGIFDNDYSGMFDNDNSRAFDNLVNNVYLEIYVLLVTYYRDY